MGMNDPLYIQVIEFDADKHRCTEPRSGVKPNQVVWIGDVNRPKSLDMGRRTLKCRLPRLVGLPWRILAPDSRKPREATLQELEVQVWLPTLAAGVLLEEKK